MLSGVYKFIKSENADIYQFTNLMFKLTMEKNVEEN